MTNTSSPPTEPAPPRPAVALVRSLQSIAAVARYGAESGRIEESLAALQIIARDSAAAVARLTGVR